MPTPLPTLPGVYYAIAQGSWNGLPSGNIFAFKNASLIGTAPDGTLGANVVATALASTLDLLYGPVCHNSFAASGVRVYPLVNPLLPAVFEPVVAPGTITGQVSPAPLALVIKHNVSRRGRGSQSRSFLSPFSMNWMHSDGKSIETGNADIGTAAWTTFLAAALANMETGYTGWEFVQLSKKGAGATYPITESVMDIEVSTQRRRARRVSV